MSPLELPATSFVPRSLFPGGATQSSWLMGWDGGPSDDRGGVRASKVKASRREVDGTYSSNIAKQRLRMKIEVGQLVRVRS